MNLIGKLKVYRQSEGHHAPMDCRSGLYNGPTPASSPTMFPQRMQMNGQTGTSPAANPMGGAFDDQALVVPPDYMIRARTTPSQARKIGLGVKTAVANNTVRARIPGLNYGGS